MSIRIVIAAVAVTVFTVTPQPLSAAPPDFSACDGLTGPALGLCKAGVAVGCDVDSNNEACRSIAEQFEEATGNPPPYAVTTILGHLCLDGSYLTASHWGGSFTITDSLGRIESSDLVVIFSSGDNPMTDGFVALDSVIESDGASLTGTVPELDILSATYLFRVTTGSDYFTGRFSDLELDVCSVPPCDGSGGCSGGGI
jgi:hypothetical protein